jgi:hypothetical protein
MLRCSITVARFIMKINLHVPGFSADASPPHAILPLIGAAVILTALAVLPAPALFLAALIGATGLGLCLAELRRHGGPDVPALPPMPER